MTTRSDAAARAFAKACAAFERWGRSPVTERDRARFAWAKKRLHAAAERYAMLVHGEERSR